MTVIDVGNHIKAVKFTLVSYYAVQPPGITHRLRVKTKLNSVVLVRERTIPTEQPPPFGEGSANFCG